MPGNLPGSQPRIRCAPGTLFIVVCTLFKKAHLIPTTKNLTAQQVARNEVCLLGESANDNEHGVVFIACDGTDLLVAAWMSLIYDRRSPSQSGMWHSFVPCFPQSGILDGIIHGVIFDGFVRLW